VALHPQSEYIARLRGRARARIDRYQGERLTRRDAMTLPIVEIEYCRQCGWLLRAAWTAQELLTTFDDEIGGVTLKPGMGGIFTVHVDKVLVWSRKEAGRHADITELKQLVRDRVAPERSLGHSDRKRAAGD
jgi:selenoprotein W-related protein